jgi:hypothetical protein
MARFSGASQKRADSSSVVSQVKQKIRLSRGNWWVSAANCEDLSGFVGVFGNVVGAHALAVRQHLHAVRERARAVGERAHAVGERANAVQLHARVVGQRDAAGEQRGDEVGEYADAALPQKSIGAVTSFVFVPVISWIVPFVRKTKTIHENTNPKDPDRRRYKPTASAMGQQHH